MDKSSKFAVVRIPNGMDRFVFSKLHSNVKEAVEESMRLCQKEQSSFLVMKVVGRADPGLMPVKWILIK